MSRYINANLLKAEFTGNFTKDYTVPLIKSIIDQQPNADVEEIRHAKWVHYGEDIQCNNCGHVSDDICYEGDMDSGYYTVLPRYCSNCGARMDLEEK